MDSNSSQDSYQIVLPRMVFIIDITPSEIDCNLDRHRKSMIFAHGGDRPFARSSAIVLISKNYATRRACLIYPH